MAVMSHNFHMSVSTCQTRNIFAYPFLTLLKMGVIHSWSPFFIGMVSGSQTTTSKTQNRDKKKTNDIMHTSDAKRLIYC